MPIFEETKEELQTVVLPDGSVRVDYLVKVTKDGEVISTREVSDSIMIWNETPDLEKLNPDTRQLVESVRASKGKKRNLLRNNKQ